MYLLASSLSAALLDGLSEQSAEYLCPVGHRVHQFYFGNNVGFLSNRLSKTGREFHWLQPGCQQGAGRQFVCCGTEDPVADSPAMSVGSYAKCQVTAKANWVAALRILGSMVSAVSVG